MANTPGKGTILQLSISAAFTTVAQGVRVLPPQAVNPEIDTTILTDTTRNFIGSIVDNGEAELECNWDPAATTHQQLKTNFDAGTISSLKIIMADAGAAEIAFSALITGWAPGEATVDNLVKLTIKLKVTGAVVVTP